MNVHKIVLEQCHQGHLGGVLDVKKNHFVWNIFINYGFKLSGRACRWKARFTQLLEGRAMQPQTIKRRIIYV